MSTIITQGSLLKSQEFKKAFSSVKLQTSKKVLAKLGLKGLCAIAAKKLFKDKKFLEALKNSTAEESVFNKIYKKLLIENTKISSVVKEDKEQKTDANILIKKSGDKILILDKQHNEVEDPKVLKKILNYIRANEDQLKSGSSEKKEQKEDNSKILSMDAFADEYGTFSETLDGLDAGIGGEDIDEGTYKTMLQQLKLNVLAKKASKFKKEELQNVGKDVATILACCVAAKAKAKKAKEDNDKKDLESKAKRAEFIEAAKKFQSQLPAAEIAKVCDLPGSSDIKISTNTKMYDINGKETNKWTLDEEIDSDDEIQEWREFLNTGDGTDTPAHPEAIAAAIAQELAGLAEANGSALDGFDSGTIGTGLALAVATGGLSLPASIGISATLKNSHVRKGQKLLEDWYNRAMEIVNKYPEYSLAKLGKKDAKHGADIKA